MPRSFLSFAFFASSQAKYFTGYRISRRVLIRHTMAVRTQSRQSSSTPVLPSSGVSRLIVKSNGTEGLLGGFRPDCNSRATACV
jgi:hypothetical protein